MAIRYEPAEADCWQCMSGAVNNITIKVTSTKVQEIDDAALWLKQCWRNKDIWLGH
jgi:hypothetical protein